MPPYVNSADQSGAVPFLDIANHYILAGAQYNPQVLAGLPAAQIASQLSNPSSPVAKAIDGSAQDNHHGHRPGPARQDDPELGVPVVFGKFSNGYAGSSLRIRLTALHSTCYSG